MTFNPEENSYSVKPTSPVYHLGNFLIKGMLSDTRLTTPFQFSVSVTNSPPRFSGAFGPRDVLVTLNSEEWFELPPYEDLEGLPVKIKM